MRKIILLLITFCLIAGMSGEAWALTYLTLEIDWHGPTQDEIIDEVVIIFRDNNGDALQFGELFFDHESGQTSVWSNSFNVPEALFRSNGSLIPATTSTHGGMKYNSQRVDSSRSIWENRNILTLSTQSIPFPHLQQDSGRGRFSIRSKWI